MNEILTNPKKDELPPPLEMTWSQDTPYTVEAHKPHPKRPWSTTRITPHLKKIGKAGVHEFALLDVTDLPGNGIVDFSELRETSRVDNLKVFRSENKIVSGVIFNSLPHRRRAVGMYLNETVLVVISSKEGITAALRCGRSNLIDAEEVVIGKPPAKDWCSIIDAAVNIFEHDYDILSNMLSMQVYFAAKRPEHMRECADPETCPDYYNGLPGYLKNQGLSNKDILIEHGSVRRLNLGALALSLGHRARLGAATPHRQVRPELGFATPASEPLSYGVPNNFSLIYHH